MSRIDTELAAVTEEMARIEGADPNNAKRDSELLARLTALSAEIEQINSKNNYRFTAMRAYHALVRSRLAELREERHEGYQTVQEFLERRLSPAMRTCESVEERMADLSRRATRAANLLRTRVDFVLQQQNQGLLTSMDTRAKLQLRLQQTVEGLSVAAITYYAVGLVGYAAKGLVEAGITLDATVAQAISVPVVAITVWLGLRRVRKRLEHDD